MGYYITKILVTVVLVVVISEIAKRSTLIGGILASVPLISVLAMIWLYVETKDVERVAALSTSVFWLVIPSLSLFLLLPVLLRKEVTFSFSLAIALGVMITCYYIMISVLGKFGIKM